jgi:hypothetical protein
MPQMYMHGPCACCNRRAWLGEFDFEYGSPEWICARCTATAMELEAEAAVGTISLEADSIVTLPGEEEPTWQTIND